MAGVNPCETCGACCAFYTKKANLVPIQITREDEQIQPYVEPSSELPIFSLDTSYTHIMKVKLDKGLCQTICIVFKGEVGKSAKCGIHDFKPKACRTFKIGEDRCNNARQFYGLLPIDEAGNNLL